MVNFEYRLLNFPSERLVKPRMKIPGYDVSNQRNLLPFKEAGLKIFRKTDFIKFTDFFTEDFNFNNKKDFKEYARSNTLYKKLNKIHDIDTRLILINRITSALKYPFVLKRMLQGLIIDDTIYTFHLPFMYESISDLEASFLLIENGFFKQSLQTLRNIIELTLAHAFFGLKGLSYDDLIESIDFRMPPFRQGKNSLLIFLKEKLIIDAALEKEIVDLYQELSGAVHSAIKMLNTNQNRNTIKYFEKWYNYLVKTCETNLKVILKMIEVGM